MIPFTEQARDYATYHQHTLTRLTHMAGIPFLVLSMMILLGFVHVTIPGILSIDLADIVTFVLLIYYFRLNWRLALVLTPILIVFLWVANLFSHAGPDEFSLWAFLILFLLGGILVLIGCFIEGMHPGIKTHLKQTLVAPMFLMAEVFFMAGRMKKLEDEIHGNEPVVFITDEK